MDIIDTFRKTKIHYPDIYRRLVLRQGSDNEVYISVIIPVQGRTEFTEVVSHFIKNAIEYSQWNIGLTFVEHDLKPLHYGLVPKWANYIFIQQKTEKFNKCLCHNVGVLYGPKSEWYNFHDVDTIMDKNYFVNILLNMMGKNALQTFTKRRLLHASEAFTKNILQNYESMKGLPVFSTGVKPAQAGAAGGSMFVSRNLFLDVGGFDPAFSEYSIEDQSFFDHLQLTGCLGFCDSPPNELIHLCHPPSFWRKTKQEDFDYYDGYRLAPEKTKKEFIKLRSDHLRSFI